MAKAKNKMEAQKLVGDMFDEHGKLKPGFAIWVDEKSACNALRDHKANKVAVPVREKHDDSH